MANDKEADDGVENAERKPKRVSGHEEESGALDAKRVARMLALKTDADKAMTERVDSLSEALKEIGAKIGATALVTKIDDTTKKQKSALAEVMDEIDDLLGLSE